MPDSTRLATVLAERYRLERQLGQGGMATVYLAQDLKHDRPVAIKVLHPELATVLGPERFLSEIRISARLDHPHILTLIDSGASDGFLYYVLPFVRGESLRDKLTREKQLGLEEALTITRQVAGALDYAHRQGVIHRDIKPENILLHEGNAVLADFGIALAVRQAGGQRLTESGLSLGTPQYMSPEQATGERELDARSDVYSLAAVLYEMLAGEPPHTGATVQTVIAKLMTERPTRLRALRDTIPEGIDTAVAKALAKVPADRFPTASEFVRALESGTAEPAVAPVQPSRVSQTPATAAAQRWWLVLAAIVGLVALGYVLWPRRPAAPADRNLVAVLPFRSAGAEPSLHYLREGMIDLLAAKLTGEAGGLRVADPRTTSSAWRRAAGSGNQDLAPDGALRVAGELGAGRLLMGGIVGSPAHLTLSATLLAVPNGSTETQANVEGPADSLPALLDRLISGLLVGSSGLSTTRQASLTTTSLEALRAYLAGQANYRRGDYRGAASELTHALQLDSTFALAALDLVGVNGWLGFSAGPDTARVQRLAWALRDRLSTRDRTRLQATLGPDFPDQPLESDLLVAQESAVQLAPDDPDIWFLLGEEYFHQGQYLGHDDWAERARVAFERAIALDSSFVGPLPHLISLALLRSDTGAARRYARRYLTGPSPSGGEGLDLGVLWEIGHTLQDSALMQEFWRRYESGSHGEVSLLAQQAGADSTTVNRMVHASRRIAATPLERMSGFAWASFTQWNSGHPRRALASADSMSQILGVTSTARIVPGTALPVVEALFNGGEAPLVEGSADRLARVIERPSTDNPTGRYDQLYGTCVLGLWRMTRGPPARAAATITRLRSVATPGDPVATVRAASTCAALLEAMQATGERRQAARQLVLSLDSLMRLGPHGWAPFMHFENLAVGRLLAELGDPERGLAAVRRGGPWHEEIFLLAGYLREEGRLAAMTGDRDGAIRAYQRYLALRPDPEPSVKPEVNAVRAELAALVAGR